MDKMELSRDLAETVADFRFPDATAQRLQDLMDRNNEGVLDEDERRELESLAEMSEAISLVRAKAMLYLGRKPV